MSTSKMNLGQRGEQIATRYLQQHSYTIVDTNWRCKVGEIDIIARQHDILVFVEVKTRYAHGTEAAFAAITPAKRKRLTHAVYAYLEETNQQDAHWRIDAIAVALSRKGKPVIDHAQDALDW